MIESVAQRGYNATTVAHVVALAGVSRRAFYEQFPNKEGCFLATYDIMIARSRKRMLEAWLEQRGWFNRVRSSCQAFLEDAARDPKGARLALIDSFGVGPSVREHMHAAATAYERVVAAGFSVAPDGVVMPPLAPRAIVGGVRHIVFTRLRAGRERELPGLSGEVLDWLDSYRSPAAARLDAIGATSVTVTTPASAMFLSGPDARARVLNSLVLLTNDEGYTRISDPQIAQHAGLSTEAFHRLFASKQECFLAALEELATEALSAISRAIVPARSWEESVRFGMGAFVEYLVAHPMLTRMALVDLFEVGPAMVEQMSKSIESFTIYLTKCAPRAHWGPTVAAEAITGAIWETLVSHMASAELPGLLKLVDHLTYIVLTPYVGAEAAVNAIIGAREHAAAA